MIFPGQKNHDDDDDDVEHLCTRIYGIHNNNNNIRRCSTLHRFVVDFAACVYVI